MQQRRAIVPRCAHGSLGDIVAVTRGNGDRRNGAKAEIGHELMALRSDFIKARAAEFDEIHLVDGQHDVPHAEHRHDVGVAARLRQNSLSRVDQDDRQIRGGSACRHIARILLVARRIRHDERASARAEVAIGDINGDALFALC